MEATETTVTTVTEEPLRGTVVGQSGALTEVPPIVYIGLGVAMLELGRVFLEEGLRLVAKHKHLSAPCP